MKKLFGFALLFVLVLAVGLYVTMQYFLGSITKAGVNKFGPRITQTRVELQDAAISPLSGIGTLTSLRVGNPQGWSAADAFRLGKVQIDLEPRSVWQNPIVINEVIIEQPEFLYETQLVSSNIGDLLKNIEKAIGSDGAKTDDGKPIKLVVKKFVLKDGKVTLGFGGSAMTISMPSIDMANIGVAEGGVTPAQLAFAVMRNVTTSVVAAATEALARGGGAGGTIESARQIGEAIKGIFGGEKKPK